MEGNKITCANLINGELKESIQKAIENKYGIKTDIYAKAYNSYVDVIDNAADVNKKMRSNKMLRAIFKEVTLGGTAWYEEETGNVFINLRISYSHPNGGANGRELGKLLVHRNGKTSFLSY